MTTSTRDSILALLVLAVPLILWLTVDDEILHTAALVVLGAGVAGVLAARWGLRRLRERANQSDTRTAILATIAMAFAASALGAFILLIFMYAG